MKNKPYKFVFLSTSLAFVTLGSLLFFTNLPNNELNGFTRKWLHSLTPLQEFKFSSQLTKISGVSKDRFYFSGADPRWVIATNIKLHPIDTIFFGIHPTKKFQNPYTEVDSPFVYMYATNISYLISGRVDNHAFDTTRLFTPIFTRMAKVNKQLLIIRGFDSLQTDQVFKKVNCVTGKITKEAPITENYNDLGFGSDGFLRYDTSTKKVVFVQMYQNQIFFMDTNLNLLYKNHTIDTAFTNQLKLKFVKNEKETRIMPSIPRKPINITCATSNGYLFVLSGLKADNENFSDFNRNVPIDIYKMQGGAYLSSFYIPKIVGKKIIDFFISNSTLIALYTDGNVATFKLPAFN